jgi:hypothetical protein
MNFGSEEANRAAKATAYADCLQAHGASAAAVAVMPPAGWELARQLCGWPTLPSDQTKAMVVDLMREREARRVFYGPQPPPPPPPDPFDGLPGCDR